MSETKRKYNRAKDEGKECPECGGTHWGSNMCPYDGSTGAVLAAPAAAEPLGTCFGGHADGHVEMASCERWKPIAEPVPPSETRDELRANLIADIHDILIVRHRARVSEQCEEDLSVIIEQYESQLLAAPSPAETSQASAVARVANLFEVDPHQFSTRPCSTCKAITEILKRNFGCDRKRAALAGPGDAKETGK